MAKNKGKFGKAKSDIDEGDQFVEGVGTIASRLKPHAVKIGVMIAVLSALLVALATYKWYQNRQHERATFAYAEASRIARLPIVAEGTDMPEPPLGMEGPTGFRTADERNKAVLAALEPLEQTYAKTEIAAKGALLAARIHLAAGQYDQAVEKLSQFAKSADDESLAVAAREGIGYAHEGKAEAAGDATARGAELEKALAAFESMQPNEKQPRHDYALFHQARVLVTLGRTKEGATLFEKILQVKPDTLLKTEIENRLALLDK